MNWINIEDRLPEIGEWVVIFGNKIDYEDYPPSYFMGERLEDGWVTDCCCHYNLAKVIAWMRLEPPKDNE